MIDIDKIYNRTMTKKEWEKYRHDLRFLARKIIFATKQLHKAVN